MVKRLMTLVLNLTNRASQREAYSYHVYRIHNSTPLQQRWRLSAPERRADGKRVEPATEQLVIAAFCESAAHRHGYLEYGAYGFKVESGRPLPPEYANVALALLYPPDQSESPRLVGVSPGFSVVSADEFGAMLRFEGVPDGLYVVYRLFAELNEFPSWTWSIDALSQAGLLPPPAIPPLVPLSRLQALAL